MRLGFAVLLLALPSACGRTHARKVIVLGVDGMDPGFVERHWDALPHLAALRRRGGYAHLATTTPPQSPVAWTTFITGLDPGAHGVFDFVERDPATLEPYSSFGRIEETRLRLPLGPYLLPLWPGHVERDRSGEAFWSRLVRRGVPSTILRIPANYPPVPHGDALAGMGTPDLRGTMGTFTYFTDDPDQDSRSVPGGKIVHVTPHNGQVSLPLEGPPNTLRRDRKPVEARIEVDIDPEDDVARFTSRYEIEVLKTGEWSEWMTADFPLIPALASSRGMFRLYVLELHPSLRIYISPVNADPEAPALPLSYPANFSGRIASRIGRFFTLGIPEDTAALRQGVFRLPEFLSQSRLVRQDERRLFEDALHRYHDGLLFFYFSSVDQNSHMLWGRHDGELLRVYEEVDTAVGEAMRVQPDAALVVLSDHGFTSFDRAVQLNRWLAVHGWFVTRTGRAREIDWSRTQAYAMGLNGLYLNLAGRELHGIVHPGDESRRLLEEIRQQLLAFRDPANGSVVVEKVSPSGATPAQAARAPDWIVGYAPGYRASWQTALGDAPENEIEDNTDLWLADHCINAADVPGVLFSTLPVRAAAPALKDLPVSILKLYGVDAGARMDGRNVF